MIRFIARRLLLLILVALGVSILVFVLIRSAPGDPVLAMIGLRPTVEQVAQIRHDLGLDQPLFVQYLLWLGRVVRGDLGTSLLAHVSVAGLILQRLPTTAALAVFGIAGGIIVGVPLGVVSAMRRDTFVDNGIRVVSMIGVSVPAFLSGLLLIIVLAVWIPIFPPGGSVSQHGPIALVLPALALAIEFAAIVLRFTRASMLEVLDQDYVRTARAKGLKPRRIEYDHALRNAVLPLITVIGLQTGTLLGGVILIEAVFAVPGLGSLLVEAVGARDYPLVMGSVITVAVIFVLVNLVVDLLYAVIDPRVRY